MKCKVYIKSILLPLIPGGIVGFITSKFMNYEMLIKPVLAPPAIVFPIVWSILYILMGISYGMLVIRGLNTSEIKKLYYGQLIVNLLWPVIFFVFKLRFLALIWIILLVYLVYKMVKVFYHLKKEAGLIQIPYLIWVLFATYLNLFFYILNK